ncbi:phosphoribosylamine--glycine ligase [Erythrobacter sp. F6033]|uniref:phosphoribosylamine--glycine ligase n=1 Tax=Erythrobacter sp. F6033 TaxID=2926401 RepID=UPI001FF5E616|nr:phosphoribosylamine--glycine ligase [Erythrobacter sp. F6033]MCK0129688.1 phosphoribosylamine--glycine ligase [Erythrobacter sp. F6033]
MNVLLLGSGGREHALAWKLAQSPTLTRLFAAPGNPGIAECAELLTLDASDHNACIGFCQENAIDLVVIGPEAPLVDGLGDSLRAANIAVFGPDKAAAQLEGSKSFTKQLCDRANIPTARYTEVFNYREGLDALGDFEKPYVIKADGLAAGKGVFIAEHNDAARNAFIEIFGTDKMDTVEGSKAVIEEFMTGEEASFFVLTDGETILPFGTAQDHKRVGEGDEGPNTGGMGAYSPAPVLTPELQQRAIDEIIRPTVDTMRAEGMPYSGVLYAGLMLTDQGPKLVEYNCRFGDPECQVLMMRLQGDLAAIMLACAKGELASVEAQFAEETALTVVMAAEGYPASAKKGGAIELGEAEASGAKVFHAGTAMKDGALVANGGRVLNVAARGTSVTAAQKSAYEAVDAISFESGFCRRDIGWREVERENPQN